MDTSAIDQARKVWNRCRHGMDEGDVLRQLVNQLSWLDRLTLHNEGYIELELNGFRRDAKAVGPIMTFYVGGYATVTACAPSLREHFAAGGESC
jgi:hypothetical protein